MPDVILHSDLNCFYAAVEMNEDPKLYGKAVAVCGSTENRHGIVLAKSYPAKARGVQTGMANWQAKALCPDLICVEPHYEKYLQYSAAVRSIYRRYSDDIEPFGMDENWISIPGLRGGETEGEKIANEIRMSVRAEMGLTVSVGVSFSKLFAKLGSDMKKPDAVTVIRRENFRELIWPLDAGELLYVGRATQRRLRRINVNTIGDLARCDVSVLQAQLGKNGVMLHSFANGSDGTRVMPGDYVFPVKSIGHGTTCVQDLDDEYQVWLVLYELSQDVNHRLRAARLLARGVSVFVRDRDLGWQEYQMKLRHPTRSPLEIAQAGFFLFRARYLWQKPVRALTIRAIDPVPDGGAVQTDLFDDHTRRLRRQTLDDAVDEVRRRFGTKAVLAASLLADTKMATDRCETVPMPPPMFR